MFLSLQEKNQHGYPRFSLVPDTKSSLSHFISSHSYMARTQSWQQTPSGAYTWAYFGFLHNGLVHWALRDLGRHSSGFKVVVIIAQELLVHPVLLVPSSKENRKTLIGDVSLFDREIFADWSLCSWCKHQHKKNLTKNNRKASSLTFSKFKQEADA